VVVPPTGSREEKVAVMTQQIANALESGIREHSHDWHMLQKVWWRDLEAQR
jgi:KDO2-lipid IV(A) lauroyltransferase